MSPTKSDSRKYLNSSVVFLFSLFVLYSFQQTDLSNPLLWTFNNVWFYLADRFTTGTCNFVSLIVKVILLPLLSLSLWLRLSLRAADKTKYLVHLSFNFTLQLINGILCDLQKFLKYLNGTAIITYLKFSLLHLHMYFLIF